jgi:hypothetical protein
MTLWGQLEPHSQETRGLLQISFLIIFTKKRKLAYEIMMLCVPFWISEPAYQF